MRIIFIQIKLIVDFLVHMLHIPNDWRKNIMESKILLPYAPILVESTRSIGYSFESALADIIDNSIGKKANEIKVYFSSQDPQYIAVVDNGTGMSEEELESAMRYGSKSSLDARDKDDLGRFGLGLKTASLSQCRKLTVITKKDGKCNAACWDLDHIIQKKDWSLICYSNEEAMNLPYAGFLKDYDSGTIVIWQIFDRIVDGSANPQKVFDEKIETARSHVSLVFHRYLDNEAIGNRVKIFFNNEQIEPTDPFLTTNAATQPLTEQTLRIDGSIIRVKPYILPFASKVSAKDKKKLGELSDLRSNQGFYIYRNKRLIIWGTWFRLIKAQELNKLARIRVDIPNTLDSIWEIDIKKSTASLPDVIKRNLVAVVENSIGRSERVYKYRGRTASRDKLQHVWETIENRGKFQYQINREMPLYKMLEDSLDDTTRGYLDSFVKALEDAFPYGDVYYRLAKDENTIDRSGMEFEDVYQVALDMIESYRKMGRDVSHLLKNLDQIDYFVRYPDVVKKIREDYGNE